MRGKSVQVLCRRAADKADALQLVDESHRTCDPLCFVFLIPSGRTGWHQDIPQATQAGRKRQRTTNTRVNILGNGGLMRALFVLIAFPSVLLNSHLNVSQLQLVCQTEFSAVGGKQLQEYVLVDHSPRREPQAVVDDVGPKEFQEVWHIREGVDFPARNMTNEPF